jgi:TolB-like protein/tetratricopeptide (TPR) repeat protein
VLFSFRDYVLDSDRRELRFGTDLVSVEPQVFDLLEYLIRNRQRVASKDDLLAAVWGGRIVSESVLTTRINAARCAIGDNGKDQRLIRTLPRKGVRFVGEVQECEQPAVHAFSRSIAPPLSDKPSIAVLPFANMTGDAEQEYFADGIVEDIITALSHMSWLFVIARNSSFFYKGRAVDVKQVGRDLGVRYVLEGSVRKSSGRVRITGQLIDACSGVHLWADRFDGNLDDVFDLQDQVTTSVVCAITPKLEKAEIERVKRKPTEDLDAYDYYLRGIERFHQRTRTANKEALQLFYRSVDCDPEFAAAYAMAAWCYSVRQANRWVDDREAEIAETARLARKGLYLAPDDAIVLSRAGHALVDVVHDFEAGHHFIDRAIALNPNLASVWYASGWLRVFIGDPETAVNHLAKFERISPFDPAIPRMHSAAAFAHVFCGRYELGIAHAEMALRENPDLHMGLRVAAMSYALAGQLDSARKTMARLREVDPTLRMSNLQEVTPLQRRQDITKYAEGLRKAGLPE